jgi:SAM-dependent methyltransferase
MLLIAPDSGWIGFFHENHPDGSSEEGLDSTLFDSRGRFMNIRALITMAQTLMLPGVLPVTRDWKAFLRMHFLYAALDTGLIPLLTTPRGKEEIAERLRVKRPELLDSLLEMGTALKELTICGDRYSLRGRRARILAKMEGDPMAALVQAGVTYYHSAYRYLGERMRGAPLGNDLEEIGEIVARFSKIGEPILKRLIRENVNGNRPLRILDVGCGSGLFLRSAYEVNPHICGTGLDVDERVVHQARENLASWGLSNRFKVVAGNIRFCPGELRHLYDVIFFFNLIYYFREDEREDLLRSLRSLLSDSGRVLFVNSFHSRGKDTRAANLNIVNCSLKGLTRLPDLETFRRQLEVSGFSRIRISRLMPKNEYYGILAA